VKDSVPLDLNRRRILVMGAWSVCSLATAPALGIVVDAACDFPVRNGVPSVDYHAHIGDGITVEQAVGLAARRGMKFGLLQHAGVKGHGYAVSNDEELGAWVRSLDGLPVFKGIEGEGPDWMTAFSKTALSELDYVQADPLAVPDSAGRPMQIWRTDFRPGNSQEFMDRYVDYHLSLITTHPIDILAVPTFLPDVLRPDYDRLWTPRRTQLIVDALIKYNVALEIDSRFRVPSHRFLEVAKSGGVKFAFGSNYQTAAGLGDISYCVEMARRLHLPIERVFCPRR
jgi:histidinol phosphatase-like PHP family hydrolase